MQTNSMDRTLLDLKPMTDNTLLAGADSVYAGTAGNKLASWISSTVT